MHTFIVSVLVGVPCGAVAVVAGHYIMNWADARWPGFSMPEPTEQEKEELGI